MKSKIKTLVHEDTIRVFRCWHNGPWKLYGSGVLEEGREQGRPTQGNVGKIYLTSLKLQAKYDKT